MTGRGSPAVDVQALEVAFGSVRALEVVSFAVAAGEWLGILGPNGAGKSTLLRALLGVGPRTGSVAVRGLPGYVPQSAEAQASFPVDALGVVLMGRYPRLGWRRRPGREDRRVASALLERLGLSAQARTSFGALSGGQRQRALVARALAQEAEVLLLDEPLNGIDAPSEAAIRAVLREQAEQGRAVLMTTHDLGQAARDCDALLLLNRRVIAHGAPEAVLTPPVLRAAYGADVLVLAGGETALLDDAHHAHAHAAPAP